jgi:hypothetical protein
MSNEEHLEEMFYHAYSSGVVTKFRKKIEKTRNKAPNLNLCEATEKVYYKMVKKGLIPN